MASNTIYGFNELSYLNPYWVIRRLDGINKIDMKYKCQCDILQIGGYICDMSDESKDEFISRKNKKLNREFNIFVSNSRYVKYSSLTYGNEKLDIIVSDTGSIIAFSDMQYFRKKELALNVLDGDVSNIFVDTLNYLMMFFKGDLNKISSAFFSNSKWSDWNSIFSMDGLDYSGSLIFDLLSLEKDDFFSFYSKAKKCECDDSRYCGIPDKISCEPDEVCRICKKLSGRRYCDPPFDCQCSNYAYLSYLVQSYFPA